MFHEGDLQSGIAAAIQQQKLVTCFIYGDDEASTEWQQTRLPQMQHLMKEKTVLLKMELHSQEAAFLSAFCPVDTTPTLVVIDNGKVVAKIETPQELQEWRRQVDAAMRWRETTKSQTTHTGTSVVNHEVSTPVRQTNDIEGQTTSTTTASTSTIQSLLPERAARLEADHVTKQAEEKAARVARAEARRQEIEAAAAAKSSKGKQPESISNNTPKARTDWINEQAKRKTEARQDRERILARIESDRQERKARQALAGQSMSIAQSRRASNGEQTTSQLASGMDSASCALQIRLIDGSSMKKQFPADQTLKDVRTWIKETAPSTTITESYTFRQFLAPQPNRNIETTEENLPLRLLRLSPSATLILVPHLPEPPARSGGVLALFYTIFAGMFGLFAAVFGIFTSQRRPVEGDTETHSEERTDARATGVEAGKSTTRLRTKTLADSRAEESKDEPAEFYNGNSSATEGRKDDD